MAEATRMEPVSGGPGGGAVGNGSRGRAGGMTPDARLGMFLFLAALGMLFAATLTGYLVVRTRAGAWPPAGSPRLPGGLWLSTVVLLLSSGTMQRALVAARAGREAALRNALHLTLILGLVFLANQQYNWQHFLAAHHLPPQANLYAFTFYMLTGLHSAHVIGGLVGLAFTVGRAGQGRYTAASWAGVERMTIYWHFLDAAWLVMFFLLLVAG
jgi:cytochrome c oxidase subunit III